MYPKKLLAWAFLRRASIDSHKVVETASSLFVLAFRSLAEVSLVAQLDHQLLEKLPIHTDQCCPGKVAPSDGKSRPFNVLWPVLPGNDLKSRGRKWSPERSIRTRHNEG